MPSTERRTRRIDVELPATGGGTVLSGASAPGAGPGIPAPGAPQQVRITGTFLLLSAVTARAGATVVWLAPAGIAPDDYLVQWATTVGFTIPSTLAAARGQLSIGLDGLPVNTLIYVRVAARARGIQGAWSATASGTTPVDTTAPDPPTSVAAVFLTSGALRVSWVKPASTNFKSVEIRIFNSAAKTVEYDLISEADGTLYDWPAARNRTQSVGGPDGSPDPAVFVELRSRSWGAVFSTIASASATLARPANVTGTTATWDGATGTCTFRWTAVAGAVGYALTIDGVARTVLGAEYAYLRDRNAQEHAGAADPVLDYSLVAVDALDQTSVTPASGTATLAPPITPAGVAHSWASAASTASADWLLTWTQGTGIVRYRLTIDGLARDLSITNRYPYALALNAQEHAGAADPVLDYSLVAVDALGQVSTTPASGTATNAAPPTVAITLSAGGMSTLGIILGQSAAQDLRDYRVRLYRNSVLIDTLFLSDTIRAYEVSQGTGSYSADVAVFDLFAQASTLTTSSSVTLDPLTLSQLRERLSYSDSLSTAPATLKAELADGVLAAGGITYASNAGWVRSILADWQLRERTEVVTLAITPVSGTTTWYLRTSTDNATWSHWSGPAVATGATGQNTTLTSVASAAAAQTAALSSATLGNSANARIDLPSVQELRYVELWLRNTAASSTVREFFPRRLVQADDLEAEAVRAINIFAGAVTADKIFGTELGAIKASLGQVVIDASGFLRSGQTAYNTGTGFWIGHVGGGPRLSLGVAGGQGLTWDGTALAVSGAFNLSGVATIGASGGLYQGTGTFASPTTGLKIFNDGGIGRLATFSAGLEQVSFDTAGRLIAGAGGVRLSRAGLTLDDVAGAGVITFLNGATTQAQVSVVEDVSFRTLIVAVPKLSATQPGVVLLSAGNQGLGATEIRVLGGPVGVNLNGTISLTASEVVAQLNLSAGGGLNVGTATGAATGEIRASGALTASAATVKGFTALTASRMNFLTVEHATTGTPAAGFGLDVEYRLESTTTEARTAASMAVLWSNAVDATRQGRLSMQVWDSTGGRQAIDMRANGSAVLLGFFNTDAIARPTVTGSRGGNAALASALTALADLGLITDSSS